MPVSAATLKKAKAKSTKKAAAKCEPPTKRQLNALLGAAAPVWTAIIAAMRKRCAPFGEEWRPSKQLEFGRYCLLCRKERTLMYLIPKSGEVEVMVALGERAYDLAMRSALPPKYIKLASEAKNFTEGRFIRFPAKAADVPHVVTMVELKLTPK